MEDIKESKKLILLYFIGYMIIGVFAISIVGSILSSLFINETMSDEVIYNFSFKLSLILQNIVEIIVLVLCFIFGRKILSFSQINKKKVAISFLIGICFFIVNESIGFLINLIPGITNSSNQEMIIKIIEENPFSAFISVVIFAPIVEELVFRGGIYNLLKNKLSENLSLILSSLIFGLLHVIFGLLAFEISEFIFLIAYFILGLGFGFIYKKTNNIYICIIVHFINNLISFLILLR